MGTPGSGGGDVAAHYPRSRQAPRNLPAAAQEIGAWVAENFTATSVGGATAYDLTAG
jgi:hypothetical protein